MTLQLAIYSLPQIRYQLLREVRIGHYPLHCLLPLPPFFLLFSFSIFLYSMYFLLSFHFLSLHLLFVSFHVSVSNDGLKLLYTLFIIFVPISQKRRRKKEFVFSKTSLLFNGQWIFFPPRALKNPWLKTARSSFI